MKTKNTQRKNIIPYGKIRTISLLCAKLALLVGGITTSITPMAYAARITIEQGNTAHSKYIDLPVGKASVLTLPENAQDVIVADPEIVDAVVRTGRKIYLFAKKPGQTNAFFFGANNKNLLNLEINVGWDTKVLERLYKKQMPDSNIKATSLQDTLILSGTVKNGTQSKVARDIAVKMVDDPEKVINNIGISGQEQVTIKVKVAEMQRSILKQLGIDWNTAFQIGSNFGGGLGLINGFGANGSPATGLVGSALNRGNLVSRSIGVLPAFASTDAAQSLLGTLQNENSFHEAKITQLDSQIAALQNQKILTEPTVDIAGADELIAQFANERTFAQQQISSNNRTIIDLQNQLTGSTAVQDDEFQLRQRTLGYKSDNFAVDSLLKALERHNLVKTLAEPNLTALSGESAKFLAGGEIPYIVSQTFGQASVDFKPYGVGLAFTPLVLNQGRVSLKISTEVSDLSSENVVAANSSYPGLAIRRAETTVELPSGGSIVMAGLIQENTRRSIDSVPGIKEVPILGPLFRSNDFKSSESELIIVATPYLVQPTHNSNIQLPTDGFTNPSDLDMYMSGRLNAVYSKKSNTNSSRQPQSQQPSNQPKHTGYIMD